MTVDSAKDYIERHLDETITLAKIGRALGVSPFHLQKLFKSHE